MRIGVLDLDAGEGPGDGRGGQGQVFGVDVVDTDRGVARIEIENAGNRSVATVIVLQTDAFDLGAVDRDVRDRHANVSATVVVIREGAEEAGGGPRVGITSGGKRASDNADTDVRHVDAGAVGPDVGVGVRRHEVGVRVVGNVLQQNADVVGAAIARVADVVHHGVEDVVLQEGVVVATDVKMLTAHGRQGDAVIPGVLDLDVLDADEGPALVGIVFVWLADRAAPTESDAACRDRG